MEYPEEAVSGLVYPPSCLADVLTLQCPIPRNPVSGRYILSNKWNFHYQSMLKVPLAEKIHEALSLQTRKGNAAWAGAQIPVRVAGRL